jgi:hypothetical protein
MYVVSKLSDFEAEHVRSTLRGLAASFQVIANYMVHEQEWKKSIVENVQ